MLKYSVIKMVELADWNKLVSDTYKRPYSLQQQDGCVGRGTRSILVPSSHKTDEFMNESVPEEVNGSKMGVRFKKWLERDPDKGVGDRKEDYEIELFWTRNFYPDINMVANDLHAKGLIKEGRYHINIDW